MEPRVNYVLVGLFVVLLGAAIVAATLWLSAGAGPGYRTYVAYFEESVAGLNPQAAVRYRGVEVGRVSQIELDTRTLGRVRLLLDIRRGIPITTGTVATLRSQALVTGLAYVELTGGTATSPRIEARPGEPYPVIPTRPSVFMRIESALPALMADLTRLIGSLGEVSERLAATFTEDNQRVLNDILRQAKRITDGLVEATGSLQTGLAQTTRATANLAQASESFPGLANQSQQALTQAQAAIAEIKAAAAGVREITGGTFGNVDQLVGQLQQLTQSLQILARDLRRNPDILLFGRQPGEPGPGE